MTKPPAPTFTRGQRVWCRTASNTLVLKVVVREQWSEGVRPRWRAVRVRGENQRVSDSFNWPIEDVFAEGEEPRLPKRDPKAVGRG